MVDTQFGLCISPGNIPDASETQALNPDYYRSIIYTLNDLTPLKATGKPLLITLNNECQEVGGSWSGWKTTVTKIADILGPQLLCLGAGNEFDLFWTHNKADVPPEFAAKLAKEAASILHPRGIKVSACSVAGPEWMTYLRLMADLCRNDVDYFDMHPYGQKPDGWGPSEWGFGNLGLTLTTAQQIAQKPVICSEYGVKIQDAGSPNEVAQFLSAAKTTLETYDTPLASWFAWRDQVGAPSERGGAAFGLRAEDGTTRPSWHAYSLIQKGTVVVPPTTPVPPIDLSRWSATVGSGILAMMASDGTQPAMASEFRPFNRGYNVPATIEECIGENGVTYRWHIPTNKHWRYMPSTTDSTTGHS